MFCKNPENDIISINIKFLKTVDGRFYKTNSSKKPSGFWGLIWQWNHPEQSEGWFHCQISPNYKPIFYQGKSLCRFDRNIGDRGVKPPTHSLLRIYSGSNFFSGKITLPRGISTGLWKITSLALLGMLFSTNQSRFPSVKWFSLKKKLPPL